MIGPKYRILRKRTQQQLKEAKIPIRFIFPMRVSAGSMAKGRHLSPAAVEYARKHPVMTPRQKREAYRAASAAAATKEGN